MNSTKKLSLALVVGATLITPDLKAAVQPIAISISPGSPATSLHNYTVPQGKVLLVEHCSASFADNNPPTPRIVLETGGMPVQNGANAIMRFGFRVADRFDAVHLSPPLKLAAGGTLTIYSAGDAGYNNVRLLGLLVDEADLYAANVDLELEAIGIQRGTFLARATVDSPRPVTLRSETSTPLGDWEPNATEKIQATEKRSEYLISTDADADQKFLRAKATTRK